MSNLNNNTTQLEILLAKVNALPEAGSGGTDTSDATATADEIFAGETAYANGQKITGTFTIEDELTEQNDLISQITTLVAQKANPPSTDTSDATATANDILSDKTAYVKGSKITGNIPNVTQATPSISVSNSGLITASATQSAGYVAAGTKSGTKQLTTQAAKTITPTTTSQTAVASGRYTTGAVTVTGDANLVADNIKSGVSIFGVAGTFEGSGGGSGGGSVETVSVQVQGSFRRIYATIYTNNILSSVYYTPPSCPDGVVANVVRGSAFVVASFMNALTVNGVEPIETAIISEMDEVYTHMFQID